MLNIVYSEIEAHLIDKLKTNFSVSGLPKLAGVDLWNNQVNEIEREDPVNWPMIYIEFEQIDWNTMAGLQFQQGISSIAFHVVQNTLDSSIKSASILQYLTEVHRALHGFSGSCFNHLVRTQIRMSNSYGNLIEHVVIYRCAIADNSAVPKRNQGVLKGVNPKKGINP